MVNYKQVIFGLLTILLAAGIIYIQYAGKVQIRVDKDKTTFYVNDSGWKIAGVEYLRLFNGTKLVNRVTAGIEVWNETIGNDFIVYRKTPYSSGAVIISKYVFDSQANAVELFPRKETHTVINASNLRFRYSLDKLTNTGIKRKLTDETSLLFGYNLKVNFPSGYDWGWIGYPYGSDSFSVQYKVPSDYYIYSIRMYDPITYTTVYSYDFEDENEWYFNWTNSSGVWQRATNISHGGSYSGWYTGAYARNLSLISYKDLSSYSNCQVSVWLYRESVCDAGENLTGFYTLNGGGSWTKFFDLSEGSTEDAWVFVDVNITSSPSQFGLYFRGYTTNDNENMAVDDVLINCSSRTAGDLFIASNGSDSNDGFSIDTPFQTFDKLFSEMICGDTAYVRGGLYRDTDGSSLSLTSCSSPTKITAYNDERAIVTSSHEEPATMTAFWFNMSNSTYSSRWKTTVNGTTDTDWGAIRNDTNQSYWTFPSEALFRNTSQTYEGIWRNTTNDKDIWIRFNDNDANPNNIPLLIFSDIIWTITHTGSDYLTIEGIMFKGGYYSVYSNSMDKLIFENNSMITLEGFTATNTTNTYCGNLTIKNNYAFQNRTSEWAWYDVYNSDWNNGAIRTQQCGSGVNITHNYVEGYYNGIFPDTNRGYKSNDLEVGYNVIVNTWDDGIEIEDFCNGQYIHHNNLSKVYVGISIIPTPSLYGNECRYEDNIIIANKQQLFYLPNTRYWGECWKTTGDGPVTNSNFSRNTCVGTNGIYAAGKTHSQYNNTWKDNIFYVSGGLAISSTGLEEDGNLYDYNLYYRNDSSIIFKYWNNDTLATTYSLSTAKASIQWDGIWDVNSVQSNPLFDMQHSFSELEFSDLYLQSISPACNMSSTGAYVGALACAETSPEIPTNLSTDLLGCWGFEDNADDYYGNLNGIGVGGVSYSNGKIGKGIDLDGIDDYINFSTWKSFNLGQQWTYSVWIKAKNTSRLQTILDGLYGCTGVYDNSGDINLDVEMNGIGGSLNSTNGTKLLNFSSGLTDGNSWHNLVLTLNGTHFLWYEDGSLIANVSYNSSAQFTPCSNAIEMLFGKKHINEDYLIYYNFDTNNATTVIDQTGNYNGTAISAIWNGTYYYKGNGSFYFDGTNDYINTSWFMDGLGQSWTISFLYSYINYSKTAMMFFDGLYGCAYSPDTSGYIDLSENRRGLDNYVNFTTGNQYPLYFSSGLNETQMRWQHIAVTLNGTQGKFYVDSMFKGNRSYTGTPVICSPLFQFAIGIRHVDLAYDYKGYIDEVKVWNRSLNTKEISETFNSIFNGSIDQMMFWNRSLNSTEITDIYNDGLGVNCSGVYEFTGVFFENLVTNQSYELGTSINILGNITPSNLTVCVDIDHPFFGYGYSCGIGEVSLSAEIGDLYYFKFNDSTRTKTIASSGEVFRIIADNRSTLLNVSMNITGTGIENLTLDIGNDGTKNYRLPGKLYSDYLIIDSLTNGLTSETFTFSGSGQSFLRYIDLPSSLFFYNISMNFKGTTYFANLSLDFSDSNYEDTTRNDNYWNITSGTLYFLPTINKHTNYGMTVGGGADKNIRVMDNEGCDETDYYQTETSPSLLCAFDNNTQTATRWFYEDLDRVDINYLTLFAVHGLTSSDNLNIKFRQTCALAPDTIGSFYRESSNSFYIYDWTASNWDLISEVNCSCIGSACNPAPTKDTGILTNTYSLTSNPEYLNASSSVLFRVYDVKDNYPTGATSERENFYLYEVASNPMVYYDTRRMYNTTTLTLATSSDVLNNITFNMSAISNTNGNYKIYISANDGLNWDETHYNEYYKHNFTVNGTQLKAKIQLNTTETSIAPYIDWIKFYQVQGPNPVNLSIDISDDGDWDYIGDTLLNGTERKVDLNNFSGEISDYYDLYCNVDGVEGCILPIRFAIATSGIINLTKLNFTTITPDSPMGYLQSLNLTAFKEECNTQECNVPINASFKSGSNLIIRQFLIGYWGYGNISMNVRNSINDINNTLYAHIYYSNWNLSMPPKVDYLEFIPSTPISKAVQPYGQSRNVPIFNLTTLNLYDKNMNLSITINASHPCINMSYANNGILNKTKMEEGQWYTFLVNSSKYSYQGIWLWTDYACNSTNWDVWIPDIVFRGCCIDCICSEDLT